MNSSRKGAPLKLSLGAKCNARFIKKKTKKQEQKQNKNKNKTKNNQLKSYIQVIYNPVDVRISVSNKSVGHLVENDQNAIERQSTS